MHHLIHLSRATEPFSEAALLDLLQYARHHNMQHDITGILAYGNGQFIQVLEGEQAALSEADFSTLVGYVQPAQLSVAGASTTDDALLQTLRTFVFPTLSAAQ